MTACRRPSTRVPTRTPAVDDFVYYTGAARNSPRAARPTPTRWPSPRLRPPARAALRAAGAHLRGPGALSGPGAAAFSVSATRQKEAAAKKARGIGAGHRETEEDWDDHCLIEMDDGRVSVFT